MYSVILVVSMAGAPEVPQFGLKSKFGCNTCQPAPVVVVKSCDTPKCGCGLFGKLKGCFSCNKGHKAECPTNDCATPSAPACGTPGAPACGTTVIPPTTGTPAPPVMAPAPMTAPMPMPAPKAEPKPAKVG